MTPQIIYLVLAFAGLLSAANQHGKEKTGKHNFWSDLLTTSIVFLLLFFGGFFDVFFK